MQVHSIQNHASFTGFITIKDFGKLTVKMREDLTKALNKQNAFTTGVPGQFFGNDNLARKQIEAVRALKLDCDFTPGKFADNFNKVEDVWRRKVQEGRLANSNPINKPSTGAILSRKTY
jgi:hypothetical protein